MDRVSRGRRNLRHSAEVVKPLGSESHAISRGSANAAGFRDSGLVLPPKAADGCAGDHRPDFPILAVSFLPLTTGRHGGMADLIERKALKLLSQAGQTLSQIISEGLCDEPQKKTMQVMLTELRGMLDEFAEAYFDD